MYCFIILFLYFLTGYSLNLRHKSDNVYTNNLTNNCTTGINFCYINYKINTIFNTVSNYLFFNKTIIKNQANKTIIKILNSTNVEELDYCYNPNDFNSTISFTFNFYMNEMINNINLNESYNKDVKYGIYYNLGCIYYNKINSINTITTLNIPLTTKKSYQQLQNILIERLFEKRIDNSTIKIYNPQNKLQIKNNLISLVNNITLYIFPWSEIPKNHINYMNYVNMSQTENYTYLYIPQLEITKIKILFTYLGYNNKDYFF